ncbi:MAG: hypothetical protein GX989_05815 [Firmicutes bacterium]|nr:hypothetical protein [Bacillota bacterium]
MRRFLFIGIIILLIMCGALFHWAPERTASSQHEDPYLVLCRIMQLAGATIEEGELHYWASLGACPEITALPALEERADELLERICGWDLLRAAPEDENPSPGSTSATAEQENGEPGYMFVERQRALRSGGRLRLLLQNMEQEGEKVVHLLITISKKGKTPALSSIAGRLPALLRAETAEENLSLCLTGHLAAQLDPGEMEKLAQNIAREIGGKELQSVTDGRMVSITGYTPDLGDYLRAENLRINLNLALRYDDHLGKTILWAGTPLITRMY